MSGLQVRIKDFRRITEASIHVEGLTVVGGKNSNGKSTLLRALRAFFLNQSSNHDCRYGVGRFDIVVDYNGQAYQFSRSSGSNSYTFPDGTLREKLGKQSLQELYPTFPFRWFQFKDSKFIPYFVYQKQTPLFDQVDVYELLSFMYAPVSVLLSVQQKLNTDLQTAKAKFNDSNVKVSVIEDQIDKAKLELEKCQFPTIEADKDLLDKYVLTEQEFLSANAEIQAIDQQLYSLSHLNWSDSLTLEYIQDVVNKSNDAHYLAELAQPVPAPVEMYTPFIDENDIFILRQLARPVSSAIPVFAPTVDQDDIKLFYELATFDSRINDKKATLSAIENDRLSCLEVMKHVGVCPTCGQKLSEEVVNAWH